VADLEEHCRVCGEEIPLTSLLACFLCARIVCHECSVKKGGHSFCGRVCADTYFFSGLDDETEEDDKE
jgi:hypothetical protein